MTTEEPYFHDFEVPTKLKEQYDIKRIAKEGSTILVEMDSKAIRFDIVHNEWQKTIANFDKQTKWMGITDQKVKQEIIIYLSEQWLKILQNGNGHASSSSSNTNDNNDRDDDSRTIAQRALELAEANYSDLFVDQFGTPYAAIRINDEHTETLSLKSSRFKSWLCRLFYESEQDVLSSENLNAILNILKARAEFDGDTKNLHLRVASDDSDGSILYDLTNKDWDIIRIQLNVGILKNHQ